MSKSQGISRRGVLAAAGAAVSHTAFAQKNTKLWSNEYWAQKGDVRLYMFRKRASAPNSLPLRLVSSCTLMVPSLVPG